MEQNQLFIFFPVRAHLSAVRELSMLASELSDGDMIQIAQAASMRTAVGLAARCQNPDPRQVKYLHAVKILLFLSLKSEKCLNYH